MPSDKDVTVLCPGEDAHLRALLISLVGPFYYCLIYSMFEGSMNQNGVYGGKVEIFLLLTLLPLLAYCMHMAKNFKKIRFVKTLHYPFMLLTVFFGVALAGAGAWGGGWIMLMAMGVLPLMILPAVAILLTGIAYDIAYMQRYRRQQRAAASSDS